MDKLTVFFRNLIDKIKAMSTKKKIAVSLIIVGIIVAIISIVIYTNNNKYGLLFEVQNAEDGQLINEILTEKKVDTKIVGSSIYVPKDQVDALKLELAPQLTDGSSGFELLDSGSQFGKTDEEFALEKQRILQGELEKTIKSLSQVENARVHITMPEDSAFVKDSTPGKAAVYLQLKTGTELTADQVKSIVALVSGSISNMPKENIEVIDDEMNLLSKGIYDGDEAATLTTAVETQAKAEADFEKKLEGELSDLLEAALGKDNVKVNVNADLDFNSKEQSVLTYDPNKVEVSTHIVKSTSGDTSNTSQSPLDNNSNNTIAGTTTGTTTTSDDSTINYNVGQTETKTISAPGEIKRITSSIVVDGALDVETKDAITQAVSGVIGFSPERNDSINVVGMNFDTEAADAAQAEIDALKAETEAAAKMVLYRNIAIAGVALLALIILAIMFLIKKRKKNKMKKEVESSGLDVVIDDVIQPKEKIAFQPLDFEVHDERTHVEEEVRKYAQEKPEQVVDIIKSWLQDDER